MKDQIVLFSLGCVLNEFVCFVVDTEIVCITPEKHKIACIPLLEDVFVLHSGIQIITNHMHI